MPRVRAWHHSAKKIKICGSDGLRIWRVGLYGGAGRRVSRLLRRSACCDVRK
jgi:hypothetical protein